ncbi:unnamed protein product, partial [Gongylonema pulchrum]|uniref:ABC transmembrane type-1 domain-containing protein n=1 Tax=Gongylonema pulchrum TaxID=637853 RepID=A0A183D3P8_9BILA
CNKENGIYAALVKAQQFQEEHENAKRKTSPAEELPPLVFRRSSVEHRNSSTYSVPSSVARASIISSVFVPRESIVEEEKAAAELTEKKKGPTGLWQLYANCQGNYTKLVAATLISIVRGLELPAHVALSNLTFKAYSNTNSDVMMRGMLVIFITYTLLGIACLIVIFAATFAFGWTAECVVDSLRLRALRNVLYQDAAYFDVPARSPALTVTRISVDAPNIKAVKYFFVEKQ